jgi:hypothetical protein
VSISGANMFFTMPSNYSDRSDLFYNIFFISLFLGGLIGVVSSVLNIFKLEISALWLIISGYIAFFLNTINIGKYDITTLARLIIVCFMLVRYFDLRRET